MWTILLSAIMAIVGIILFMIGVITTNDFCFEFGFLLGFGGAGILICAISSIE
jgi:hypothetical protein